MLVVSFTRTNSCFCIYHLVVWSKLNLLHYSEWITSPVHSCLVFYTFYVSLLLLLTMWLIVPSFYLHNLHLTFGCVLSIFASTLVKKKVTLETLVGATPFPGLLHSTLDPYLIMMSGEQGGIVNIIGPYGVVLCCY